MRGARSLFLAAICAGCFGFGNQVFALGESCTADAFPGKSGVCADYDDRATYDVSSAGCAGIAFKNMSCAADSSVSSMVCAVECSVVYVSSGSASGAGTVVDSGTRSGSGGAPRGGTSSDSGGASSGTRGGETSGSGGTSGTSSGTRSGSGDDASSDSGSGGGVRAASCSGGGRSGSCVAGCSSPSDLISPASECADGESCCASAAAPSGSGGSGAGAGGGAVGDVTVPNTTGFVSLEDFLTRGILPWLQGVVATLALVFFIIGALLYMTGGVNEGGIKQGKAAMTASLIGFAIALAAPMFLKEIYGIFGVAVPSGGPTLVGTALNVLRFLLSIIGIFGTIMLVVSGLSYMGSAGADDKAKAAKKMATYAVVGIALALAALIIIRQITKFFV